MSTENMFELLWKQYSDDNPAAGAIHKLFTDQGEKVINDHVAFRTFDDPRVNIRVLAKPFLELGYREAGTYIFKAKKLRASHFEVPGKPELPRVFISELILDEFSPRLKQLIQSAISRVDEKRLNSPTLIMAGSLFGNITYEDYLVLREESEYAAWVYAFGYRANHFTVSINYLENFEGIEGVNAFLKQNGHKLNSSGGEIKGSPEQLLEQSSTLADKVEIDFTGSSQIIPGCYYEFARRYKDDEGRLFSGFIADSADKIFESTDFR